MNLLLTLTILEKLLSIKERYGKDKNKAIRIANPGYLLRGVRNIRMRMDAKDSTIAKERHKRNNG